MAPRQTYVLGTQNLVRGVMLQHAVLVNAGLVGEGILADDRLVPRYRHARDAGDETRSRVQAARLNSGRDVEEGLAGLQRHDDFLERAVARALTDSVDGALDLARTGNDRGQAVRHRHAEIVVTV